VATLILISTERLKVNFYLSSFICDESIKKAFQHLQSNQTVLDTFRRRRCLLLIPDGGLWGQRGDQFV